MQPCLVPMILNHGNSKNKYIGKFLIIDSNVLKISIVTINISSAPHSAATVDGDFLPRSGAISNLVPHTKIGT